MHRHDETSVQVLGTRLLLALLVGCALPAGAEDKTLVKTLATELKVTEPQAEGGARAILGYGKSQMKNDDWAKVTTAIPEIGTLTSSPSPETKSTGTLQLSDAANALSSLGGSGGGGGGVSTAGNVAAVVTSFQQNGLSLDLVGKFVPIVVSYVDKKGGDKSTTTTLVSAIGPLSQLVLGSGQGKQAVATKSTQTKKKK